jgi:hypothetical protein
MTKADNRGLAGIPSAVLGLFVAGNLLVVVIVHEARRVVHVSPLQQGRLRGARHPHTIKPSCRPIETGAGTSCARRRLERHAGA